MCFFLLHIGAGLKLHASCQRQALPLCDPLGNELQAGKGYTVTTAAA
jgi:hypothetical protein